MAQIEAATSETSTPNDAAAYIATGWQAVVVPTIDREAERFSLYMLREILGAYSQSSRHYHNLAHIADGLTWLEAYRGRPDYRELWFAMLERDEIYDPRSRTNEEDSADWAVRRIDGLWLGEAGGIDPELVRLLILGTKDHSSAEEPQSLFNSVDLAILAAPEEQYDAYAAAIRQEHHFVRPPDYRRARTAVLEGLMAGDGPYKHPDFAHMNPQAIANMRREITRLKQF